MKKIILSTLLATGFVFTGINSYADSDHAKEGVEQTQKVQDKEMSEYGDMSGEVTEIDGDTVKFKDENGAVHSVEITGFQELEELQAESLEVGDSVVVSTRNGEPYAVSKVGEPWSINLEVPEVDLASTSTLKGKVTDVQGDTIKFKSKDGVERSAKITSKQDLEELQTETIEEGDIVIVSIRDGVPYSVSKSLEAWSIN